MAIQIGLNGFGRIGRLVLRRMIQDGGFNVVAINDITDAKTLAYLFKYDSVHGVYPGKVSHAEGAIIVDGKQIKVIAEKDPSKLPWKDLGADIVMEGTGVFTSREKLQMHVTAGREKGPADGPGEGRDRRDDGDGRERRQTDRQRGVPVERLLHHQLPGPDGQGAAPGIRASSRGT